MTSATRQGVVTCTAGQSIVCAGSGGTTYRHTHGHACQGNGICSRGCRKVDGSEARQRCVRRQHDRGACASSLCQCFNPDNPCQAVSTSCTDADRTSYRYRVSAVTAINGINCRVYPARNRDQICRGGVQESVVANAAAEDVNTVTAGNLVVAVTAVDGVSACSTVDGVVAGTSSDVVVAGIARDVISTSAGRDRCIACAHGKY